MQSFSATRPFFHSYCSCVWCPLVKCRPLAWDPRVLSLLCPITSKSALSPSAAGSEPQGAGPGAHHQWTEPSVGGTLCALLPAQPHHIWGKRLLVKNFPIGGREVKFLFLIELTVGKPDSSHFLYTFLHIFGSQRGGVVSRYSPLPPSLAMSLRRLLRCMRVAYHHLLSVVNQHKIAWIVYG